MPAIVEDAVRTKQILIVEDDKAIWHALSVLLKHYEFKVKLAHSVADGIAAVDEAAPDALILDLQLPDGDGSKVLEKVRMSNMDTKVLVVSAMGDPVSVRKIKNLHPEKMLQKPIEFYDLLEAVKSLL